ncbi:MAG: phosphate acetyltransferase [Prevotellaceae bacterium]|jgi:phosphate acetyltransferase|nr:phosphate acetyltransferase [Prevotellaceae bacterium]
MELIKDIIARAKSDRQRIVLPEATEKRIIKAAETVLRDGIADIILLGNKTEIEQLADQYGLKNISKATIIDPENNPKSEIYADLLFQLRKEKGMTREQAIELTKNPLYLSCLLIKNGDADGEVAGARNYTGNVLRPAFQIIKTKPGVSVVSGAFLMIFKDKTFGYEGKMLFADCAATPNPTAEELAHIAVCSAETAKHIYGFPDPRVAILSFSTKGSAKHPMVDKVIEATKIAKTLAPKLKIDGELQADAAIVPSVAKEKAPESEIAGTADVLIFPSLEAGNIAYKLVQRLAGAQAIGPLLQGLASPINDLSRGCSIEDIVKLVAITAGQAIVAKSQTN